MRGEVEVWSGDDLVLKEPNMLVDGAGELLADIMTVSPSLSSVDDLATSSIVDASNYTIQAISFGTGSEAFQTVGRDLFEEKISKIIPVVNSQVTGVLNTAAWKTVYDATEPYQPNQGFFVEAPNPAGRVLSENSDVSSAIDIDGRDISISSLYPGNGQHVNFMPSAIRNYITDSTILDTSAEFVGNLMGSYPAGTSERGSAAVGAIYYLQTEGTQTLVALNTGSYPNEASSMDVSGFMTMIMSSVPDSGYPMADLEDGLAISANADFAENGIVEYSTKLSKDDVHSLNAFGGIYQMGLWTINMKESLLNGNTPPFAFSVLDNPRKYKLFCRKTVSKDLTYITDRTLYEDLTIKWRLHFL
tara:strand:- start:9717 stop:10796 length:1080 start_codon:yes stop_codon:yes gene_type:complete